MCTNPTKTFILIISSIICNGTFAIITTQQEPSKPSYTSGIKTRNWQSQNTIHTHQNYSKVLVHNPDIAAQYVVTQTERTIKLYPVYNGHSYGGQNVLFNSNNLSQSSEQEVSRENRVIYKRKIEYKTLNVYEKCPPGETGQFIYSLSCNQFLNCWKGRGSPQTCAPGTLFNPKTLECDFPDKVECLTGPRQSTLTRRVSKSVKQATCPDGFSGLIPNYTDCSNFINCNGGQSYPMVCPPGTLFDMNRNVCDFPYKAACFNGQNQNTESGGFQGQRPAVHGLNQNEEHSQNYYGGYQLGGHYITRPPGTGQHYHGDINSKLDFGQKGTNCNGQECSIRCNPNIQNCASNYGGNVHQVTGSVNQFTSGQNGCDPTRQNCGQSSSSSKSYSFAQTNTPQSHNYGRCNPLVQNCNLQPGQYYDSSKTDNCNPLTQNCQQYSGINSKTHISSGSTGENNYYNLRESSRCNPLIENCKVHSIEQSIGNKQVGNNFDQTSYNSNQGSNQFVQSGTSYSYTQGQNNFGSQQACNPNIQNCNLYPNNGHSISNTQTQGGIVIHPQRGKCNPNVENCGVTQTGHSHIQDQQKPTCTYGNCPNYNIICNINDPNCRKSHQLSKNQTPKCPSGHQGIIKHPWDCKKFLNCANGQTFIQDCSPGTLFNPQLGTCDFEYNVKCESEADATSNTATGYQEGHGSYGTTTNTEGQYYQGQGGYSITNTGTQYHQGQRNYDSSIGYESTSYRSILPLTKTYVDSITKSSYYGHRHQGGAIRNQIDYGTEGPNPIQTNNNPDYIDVFDPNESTFGFKSTTARSVSKQWPPPYPTTLNEDYEFEYEDGEPVTLKPENVFYGDNKKSSICDEEDFHCSNNLCVSKGAVCNGRQDCPNGKDEYNCEEYTGRFKKLGHYRLEVMEKQKWINVTVKTCAYLCIQTTSFNCRSFNYRKLDQTCFLSDMNVGLTGGLRLYYPVDYFELKDGSIECSDKTKYFKCPNQKCLTKSQLCDGVDDCGDRTDEKNCQKEDFGYSIRLTGSDKKNEGRIEITAFGKKGYICDDKFDITDANVVCRELGFELGAMEVKGQSFFAKDVKERKVNYLMDDLDCIGNETSLLDCDFSGWGVHNCRDLEIVGVECKTPQEKCSENYWKCDSGNECIPIAFVCDNLKDCSDDSDESEKYCKASTEIRLVNGSNEKEGRLEIKHHGVWGTVCDDDFNEDAAKVVCRHLGFRGQPIIKKDGYFGSGTGPIWLDQVSCYGNETSIENCTLWDWGEHNCVHDEDVGVICNAREELRVSNERHSKHVFSSDLPSKLSAEGRCGFRKDNMFLDDMVHARVVSGYTAKPGDYPWQAAIKVKVKDKTAHWCGAIVISSKWVLTAAHCLKGYAKSAYVVVAGEYNTDENEGTEQQKYIEEFFIHEMFRKGHKMNNDIALIKLKGTGFTLNDDVQPVCLPDVQTSYEEKALNCTISGFGSIKSGLSAYSHNLMAAWIPIHKKEICKMPHIYGDAITEGMICAGLLDGGVDACDGDSGGPLACLDRGVFTLYGITSWGQHCGYANKPGVYVKVAYYRKWIDDIIQKHTE